VRHESESIHRSLGTQCQAARVGSQLLA
jgi:hypothetical protein